MNFFNFTLNLVIVLLTIISVVKLWCNAVNEVRYSFHYSIDYPGLLSQQWEERTGDIVHGSYSFLQPDGLIRSVHYQADKKSGFRAIVNYRKISDQHLVGHLRFPSYFKYPIVLAKPVNLITEDLFKTSNKYPNLPN